MKHFPNAHSKWWLLSIGVLTSFALAQGGKVLFVSTQFNNVTESQSVRTVILKGAPADVEFLGQDTAAFYSRVQAEQTSGKVQSSLLGGLHGDFSGLTGSLDNVDDVLSKVRGRGIPNSMITLGKLGTKNEKYIPWAQATYVMVANKQALPFLPAGADINKLTYKQLAAWGKNIKDKTGQNRLGFPAGPNGLIHRFVQGYLLPSYTSSVVTRFRSPLAVSAWKDMQEIWKYTNTQSTSYNFMQEPLLSGEVWVGWDHVARLKDALDQKPNDFVVFPAPGGPRGHSYMPVIAGLSIPKGAPNRAGAVATIDALLKPQAQMAMPREVGFFPVIAGDLPADLPQGTRMMAAAVALQAKTGTVSVLPVGLGSAGGEFSKVYIDTFQRIVVRKQDIKEALDTETEVLNTVLQGAKAPCWAPDTTTAATCQAQ